MVNSETGGPAFPTPARSNGAGGPHQWEAHSTQGMTLRDYFAGQALTAMRADIQRGQEYGAAMDDLASKAYVIADAMIEQKRLRETRR